MWKWIKIINRFPKVGAISLALVVAVTSMGVGYSCYTYGWPWSFGTQCVPTTTCECNFSWVVSNDDGHQTSINSYGVIDPGDNNIGEIYDYWGATSSRDPSGLSTTPGTEPLGPGNCGQAVRRTDKDVARTKASICKDPGSIGVTIENAYPYYAPRVCFGIKCPNAATVITKITVYEDAVNWIIDIPDLTTTVSGIWVGQQIAPGTEAMGSLGILVNQVAKQGATYKIKVVIEFKCYTMTCGTGYAYGGCYATCFLNIPYPGPYACDNNWGWSNGKLPLNASSWSKTWLLYVGAAQCDLNKGTKAGTVTVSYNAGTKKLTITYNLYSGYTLSETHVWVGTTYLPKDTSKNCYKTAPGQFNYGHTLSNYPTTDTYTIDVTNVAGGCGSLYNKQVYIAIHAGVCWFQ